MPLTKVQSQLLGTGAVLQVVQGTYATQIASTTSTFADTGLTATITPTSATSKILVIVDHNGCMKTNNTFTQVKLFRNGSEISKIDDGGGYTNSTTTSAFGTIGISYLDSPASTSAVTYKTQFASGANIATVYIGIDAPNSVSTITLMEIAG